MIKLKGIVYIFYIISIFLLVNCSRYSKYTQYMEFEKNETYFMAEPGIKMDSFLSYNKFWGVTNNVKQYFGGNIYVYSYLKDINKNIAKLYFISDSILYHNTNYSMKDIIYIEYYSYPYFQITWYGSNANYAFEYWDSIDEITNREDKKIMKKLNKEFIHRTNSGELLILKSYTNAFGEVFTNLPMGVIDRDGMLLKHGEACTELEYFQYILE